MKKLLIIGVLVALTTGCKSESTYEYYDLNGNYGTSSQCELTENGAMCLINGDMVLVSQFSER